MPEVLINGRTDDRLPVTDRGLLYGDGLFETVAFHLGRAPLWELHMERLALGCDKLGIASLDTNLLADEALCVTRAEERAIVRIIITRGSGGNAYQPPDNQNPVRIVQRRAWPSDVERQQREGIRLITSKLPLAGSPVLSGLKHLNRLEQVLIAAECMAAGASEALVYASDGRLAEALSANVVLVIGDRLFTPRQGTGGVHGVGLEWLRREAGDRLEERDLDPEDVARAEELLVINSIRGIRPANAVDERRLAPGPIARFWQARWGELFKLR